MNSLKLITRLVNLGDAKSLACHPASTTHRQMSAEQQRMAGVLPETIRLSIGIEHVSDIIEDIDQALAQAAALTASTCCGIEGHRMSLVFDKHRLISNLALPPTEIRQAAAVANRHNADTVLTIGLVNNMPDAALQATERQFKAIFEGRRWSAGLLIFAISHCPR